MAEIVSRSTPTFSQAERRRLSPNMPAYIGWFLLACAFVAGCAVVYRGVFVDEADNLATGALLARGDLLYRDVFSHHFPFAYYWSAAIQGLFGPSIFAIRMSVLLFQIMSFALVMRLTGYTLTLGLASLMWNTIGYMQLGNMLLYNVFCGVSWMAIFALVLAVLVGKRPPGLPVALAVGVFSSIAVLSDPLSVYAVVVTLPALACWRGGIRYAALATGLLILVLTIYAVYLLVSSTFSNFVDDALVFNIQTYGKYTYTTPVRFGDFLRLSIQGLRIVDFALENPDPLWSLPPPTARTLFDGWLFTGFLYRLAILVSVLTLAFQRRFLAALFLYFGTVALLLISQRGFHAHSFTLVGLLSAAAVITGGWLTGRGGKDHSVQKMAAVFSRVLIGCMVAWLVFRGAAYTIGHREQLSYESNFGALEAEAERIRTVLSCDVPNVSLGYYPGSPIINWFTGMEPISRYTFMWPWVAEIGLPDVLDSLDTGLILIRVDETSVWGYKTHDYLRDLLTYLDRHYVLTDEGWYMSPELAAQCTPQ